jgi:N-ethylmaleimide reductase
MAKLFSPLIVGRMSLTHRVVMAPITRLRSEKGDAPGALMAEHYEQRASKGGFIVAEAAAVSTRGIAYAGAPGIYNDSHTAGWKTVVDRVHARGGYIYLQLFHGGRTSHPDLQPNGDDPVGPSAILGDGFAATPTGMKPVTMPRALSTDEVVGVVDEFRKAAERALAAGFDGVELHAANGYLPDQFIRDGSNQRTDRYGGSIENRSRFVLETTQALIDVWGSDRVAVRLSPSGEWGGMFDSDSDATFTYLTKQLDALDIAYLSVIEPRFRGDDEKVDKDEANKPPVASKTLRAHFRGPLIAAGNFKGDSARAIVDSGDADLVAFGREFIANPDLPYRLQHNLALNRYVRDTFYGGDAVGYTDYPFHEAKAATA